MSLKLEYADDCFAGTSFLFSLGLAMCSLWFVGMDASCVERA